jgi:hypothetical protein
LIGSFFAEYGAIAPWCNDPAIAHFPSMENRKAYADFENGGCSMPFLE